MMRVRDLSIRTTMCLVLVAMATIMLAFATGAVREAQEQAAEAEQVITLVRASRALLQTLNVARFERGRRCNSSPPPSPSRPRPARRSTRTGSG